jgi:broad specificity phosphatase PhoE
MDLFTIPLTPALRKSEGNVPLSAKGMEDDDPNPLTQHGRLQAEALGQAWKDTRIDHLVLSPLQRAHDTAKALSNHNKDHPGININPLLVERKWGRKVPRLLRQDYCKEAKEELTGEPWYHFAPCPFHRPAEGGESLLDVSDRAAIILTNILQSFGIKLSEPPAVFTEEETTADPAVLPDGIPHIVIVSHGLFLIELYGKLYSRYLLPECYYENASW